MIKRTDKYNRLQQLTILLKVHPEGLRKADIARRLGVHRSTVGRYIDQLSLSIPLWERNSLIGIENCVDQDVAPLFNVFEGSFLLSLIHLYQQELNIKNPHASSVIRKLSAGFRSSAPVLAESILDAAEELDHEETLHSAGYIDNFEKISIGWTNQTVVKFTYMHNSSGESCSALFEPQRFFTFKESPENTGHAVSGICRRSGKICNLRVSDFTFIEHPVVEIDIEKGYQNLFCPISEFALSNRPSPENNRLENLSIKEANHRIKNSLFMASGLIGVTFADQDDAGLQMKSRQLQSRIDSIALIHQHLTNSKGVDIISLRPFLVDIVDSTFMLTSAGRDTINKRLKISNIKLVSSKALPLGMIVSELLMNSFTHASGDGELSISLTITGENGTVRLRYADGGNNFNPVIDGAGMGTTLIKNLCRQLSCRIKYKNNFFILEFPV
ncbi:MAG TPA: hypothetical protein DCO79_06520 [Spirochaeta sp.]|nr:hypothetical protein [Spirochaeta sp.]